MLTECQADNYLEVFVSVTYIYCHKKYLTNYHPVLIYFFS